MKVRSDGLEVVDGDQEGGEGLGGRRIEWRILENNCTSLLQKSPTKEMIFLQSLISSWNM